MVDDYCWWLNNTTINGWWLLLMVKQYYHLYPFILLIQPTRIQQVAATGPVLSGVPADAAAAPMLGFGTDVPAPPPAPVPGRHVGLPMGVIDWLID